MEDMLLGVGRRCHCNIYISLIDWRDWVWRRAGVGWREWEAGVSGDRGGDTCLGGRSSTRS